MNEVNKVGGSFRSEGGAFVFVHYGEIMLLWEATGDYEEAGGRELLEPFLKETLAAMPREHLRSLNGVRVLDTDPKGRALGVYRQDTSGSAIDLYLAPHMAEVQFAPAKARYWAVRLSLAHTLIHEIGHHQTLCLNRRTEPTRKKAKVTQTLEKWAEEYVGRRLQKTVDMWLASGGAASEPDARAGLLAALRFYEAAGRITLISGTGTKQNSTSSTPV